MTWKIKAVAGPFVGQEITIDQNKIIGRDPSVDIVLQGGHISRRHAELSIRDNQLWLKDLNSANGTFVNDHRIAEQQLQQHDELQIDVVR
ncbi:FHA domain-containing protein, partial [Rhizobium hidalgonense]